LSHILRARCLLRTPQNKQAFSTGSSLRAADHGDHYDPPTGWLFGVKPGQKYVKEGWENIWYYGFIGSILVTGVAYVFKPDTSYVLSKALGALSRCLCSSHNQNTDNCDSIQTWALEEARRRLEAEGILEDPDKAKK
jgi:hypothetical protein